MTEETSPQQTLLQIIAAYGSILEATQRAVVRGLDAGRSPPSDRGKAEALARLQALLPDMYLAAGGAGTAPAGRIDKDELGSLYRDVQGRLAQSRALAEARSGSDRELDDLTNDYTRWAFDKHDEMVRHLSILGPWPPHR